MKLFDEIYYYLWRGLENNCNSFLIAGEVLVLIDPGHLSFLSNLEDSMGADGFSFEDIDLIINTHCHPDHSEGNKTILERSGAGLGFQLDEFYYMNTVGKRLAKMLGVDLPFFEPDFYLKEGKLVLGKDEKKELWISLTPGHSPGSICVYLPCYKVLLSGDLIFFKGVGRTDFPGGDGMALKESINKMSEMEIDCLLPGHGDIIRGREEVVANFRFLEEHILGYM